MISDVASSSQGKTKKGFDRKRLLSGLLAGAFGLLVVGLGGWWFTLALGVIVHLGVSDRYQSHALCVRAPKEAPRDSKYAFENTERGSKKQ